MLQLVFSVKTETENSWFGDTCKDLSLVLKGTPGVWEDKSTAWIAYTDWCFSSKVTSCKDTFF